MSICSHILLQINAKLGGVSYKAILDKTIKERKLMIIGIDASHKKGNKIGVAYVSTINDSFTDFLNKGEIIEKHNKEKFKNSISLFIEQSVEFYKKENKESPRGIIIFRFGIYIKNKRYLEKK